MDKMSIDKIPIIDCHAHLLFPEKLTYPWMQNLPYTLLIPKLTENEYKNDQKNLPIKGLIFMEACPSDCLEEAKILENLSNEKDSIIIGIITGIPMKTDSNSIKDYLKKIAHNKLVGVRNLLKTDKMDRFYLEKEYSEKLQLLKENNLPFHIGNNQYQLTDILKFVKSNPDITFLIDHLGNPFEPDGEKFNFWQENIDSLATCDNLVMMKISPGYCYPNNHLDKSGPYIEHVIKKFGSKRLVVGSDYGHGSGCVKFEDWINLIRNVMIDLKLSQEDVENIFYRNAERIYNLNKN